MPTIECSDKEERLIYRRRKTWYKAIRFIGCGLLIVYGLFLGSKFKEQLSYQDAMNAIPKSHQVVGGPPVFNFAVAKYAIASGIMFGQTEESRLVADHLNQYIVVLDSLGLSSKTLGFNLDITVVPFHAHGQRRCTSQFTAYSTDCGCEKDSLNRTVLQIDSSGTHVSVATSQLVALTNIQP